MVNIMSHNILGQLMVNIMVNIMSHNILGQLMVNIMIYNIDVSLWLIL